MCSLMHFVVSDFYSFRPIEILSQCSDFKSLNTMAADCPVSLDLSVHLNQDSKNLGTDNPINIKCIWLSCNGCYCVK